MDLLAASVALNPPPRIESLESVSRPSSSVFTRLSTPRPEAVDGLKAFEHILIASVESVLSFGREGTALFLRRECIIYVCGKLSLTAVLLCF